MQVTPLPGAGAEITGVDIRRLTAGEFAAIEGVYADHGVIFFRDQALTEDD
ncbi:MAG TPA: TauD/TfdA family dioxygenase, partial [Hyphomonas sp.]|nr:TauD/TfdA family dioxygenase [Hyphomonas sp.]